MAEETALPINGGEEQAASSKGPRPVKPLPTNRIKFEKQLDLLRAFVAASGPSGKVVTNKDVAEIVKMADTTISLANSFFVDSGLIQRADNGFLPSAEVVSFVRMHEWNPETAAHKLAPLFTRAWFGEAIMPRVSFRPLEKNEATTLLAEACKASPEYRPQLETLLDYMAAAGMIVIDGNTLRAGKPTGAASSEPTKATTTQTTTPPTTTPDAPRAAISTAFSQAAQGAVQFHVSVKVDMAEFSGWQPDRIAAFFAGIAQVLAAKGAIEKGASE
jgi:hypothetical protein